MSETTLKKAEVIITINSAKQLDIGGVKLINFPNNPNPEKPNVVSSTKYSDVSGLAEYTKDKGGKFSQIIIENLHPKFNPLQVKLIGKYDQRFKTLSSINFVDVFQHSGVANNNISGPMMYINKDTNKLTISNFVSMLLTTHVLTSPFSNANTTTGTGKDRKVTGKDHVIGKIIILYDLDYKPF